MWASWRRCYCGLAFSFESISFIRFIDGNLISLVNVISVIHHLNAEQWHNRRSTMLFDICRIAKVQSIRVGICNISVVVVVLLSMCCQFLPVILNVCIEWDVKVSRHPFLEADSIWTEKIESEKKNRSTTEQSTTALLILIIVFPTKICTEKEIRLQ